MAKGNNKIEGLSHEEWNAAMVAIKLVRGNKIRNAYLEGWVDGAKDNARLMKGEKPDYENYGWDASHAKALNEPGVDK